ncbi:MULTISPECIES: hypothetical protein [unclassified Nostoc]|jgi:hypothetical protein
MLPEIPEPILLTQIFAKLTANGAMNNSWKRTTIDLSVVGDRVE